MNQESKEREGLLKASVSTSKHNVFACSFSTSIFGTLHAYAPAKTYE